MATVRDTAILLVGSLVVVGIILVSGPVAGVLARYASDTLGISAAAVVLGLILAIPLAAVVVAWRTSQEVYSLRLGLERHHEGHQASVADWSERKAA